MQGKLVRPFKGVRPTIDLAQKVAAHPYDVVNREEAAELAKGNKYSFFHVNKPEIDIAPEISVYDSQVYQKGKENFERFIREGTLQQDDGETFYVYKQIMGNHEQVGVVATASVDAYDKNIIKKHEFTRPVKENDRVKHIETLGAQVGPVFLTYKANIDIDNLVASVTKNVPEYDFEADDNTRHVFWVIKDQATIDSMDTAFNKLDCLYVADGHHRSAAASRVNAARRKEKESERAERTSPSGTDSEGTDNDDSAGEVDSDDDHAFFLSVLFPHNQMQILDYNRLVKDLNGFETEESFIEALKPHFNITPVADCTAARPKKELDFAVFMAQSGWLALTPTSKLLDAHDANDPVGSLDVSVLSNLVLDPLLGIKDQRTDKRIDFVGGIRGLEALEARVVSGEHKLAIALYPTSIESLMTIADANEVMPPKSTWFEPKLKSGLIVHKFSKL